MGLIIGSFSDGWQNKARPELMKDSAVFMCRDCSMDELGSLTCRQKHSEETFFSTQTNTSEIESYCQLDIEGVDHKLIYYVVGSTLYRWNSFTGASTAISTAVTKSHVSYAPLKPVLSDTTFVFITDGVTMLCDNGTSTKTWGIDPPENLPLVSMAGSGGSLSAGDYSYRYTFYDHNTGSESDPSVASATTTAAADDEATLTNIEVSPDSRVTRRRIYRTLVGGGSWYLVASLNDNVTTTYTDATADANLTTKLITDQGIPQTGDIVVSFKNRLFMSGDSNYPNRVYFSMSEKPDNWPSTNYLDVGTSNDSVENIVEFEGKLYFMQRATISGLYGSDADTFAYHKTRSHVGVWARWSVASGPDGIYFLGHDGVYRFDGLKSVRISEAIDRTFGQIADTWTEVVDSDTVKSVARGVFLEGVYYLLLPMKNVDGTVTNRILSYNAFQQTWLAYDINCSTLFSDQGRGKLYGGLEKPDDSGKYSVYELMSATTGTDTASPQATTKSFNIVPQREDGQSRAVGWLRKFRVDCKGSWTLTFYVDGTLEHSQALTDQSASTRYAWYDFGPNTKGRYLQVHIEATGSPLPETYVFNELEVV